MSASSAATESTEQVERDDPRKRLGTEGVVTIRPSRRRDTAAEVQPLVVKVRWSLERGPSRKSPPARFIRDLARPLAASAIGVRGHSRPVDGQPPEAGRHRGRLADRGWVRDSGCAVANALRHRSAATTGQRLSQVPHIADSTAPRHPCWTWVASPRTAARILDAGRLIFRAANEPKKFVPRRHRPADDVRSPAARARLDLPLLAMSRVPAHSATTRSDIRTSRSESDVGGHPVPRFSAFPSPVRAEHDRAARGRGGHSLDR